MKDTKQGDGSKGELIWQTVLNQIFPIVRKLYLSLTPEDKELFDIGYNTLFFCYSSPMPLINGEKLLALMESGTVEVVKLGDDYRFIKDDSKGCYQFVYRNQRGEEKRDSWEYVIDARGQKKSFETNLKRRITRRPSGTMNSDSSPNSCPTLTSTSMFKEGLKRSRINLPSSSR